LGISGLTPPEVQRVADRWCGVIERGGESALRLVVPSLEDAEWGANPKRIRIGALNSPACGHVEIKVGPHAVVTGKGNDPDVIRYSRRRAPSRMEHELLVDLGINHLLARQGLPVVHACAFELERTSILGLGESFSGKTTVSVAAMRAGGQVVSDDVVLAVPSGDGVCSLVPVRSYGWLRDGTREIVPGNLQNKMVETSEDGQPRWVINREDAGQSFAEQTVPRVFWIQSVDRRLKKSRVEEVNQGTMFAALIRSSSPLYLSRHFPEIRDKLIPVFRSLCEQCRGYRVRLGRRLLEDPEGEMARLIELSGASDRAE
jgi:hypothetical protein